MAMANGPVCFNMLASDVQSTAQFFEEVVGLKRLADSDHAHVLFGDGDTGAVCLGIVYEFHEEVPRSAGGLPQGGYLSFRVSSVIKAAEAAMEMGLSQIEDAAPAATGPKRALVRGPNDWIIQLFE